MHMTSRVLPRFRVSIYDDSIRCEGTPLGDPFSNPKDTLARRYCQHLHEKRRLVRQVDVLNARPDESRHDYLLARLICARNSILSDVANRAERLPLEIRRYRSITPVFAVKPEVSTRALLTIRVRLVFFYGPSLAWKISLVPTGIGSDAAHITSAHFGR